MRDERDWRLCIVLFVRQALDKRVVVLARLDAGLRKRGHGNSQSCVEHLWSGLGREAGVR